MKIDTLSFVIIYWCICVRHSLMGLFHNVLLPCHASNAVRSTDFIHKSFFPSAYPQEI